ncbi:lipocalin-like domain-containing protein [Vibrio sp. SCSIO 43136]|uniref:lipocalin-like domain-containing protein n=1 Tax=Vibrio sp. SCSIO 43136 TaxID=2819101 RepID=UPI00207537E0|nr:lipocalin-like domain-containing protein [Vibrio sp. SCSIO 43136]
MALVGCEPEPSTGFGSWMGESDSLFTPVTADRGLIFPQDHQAHQDFRHEWWYLTANLIDQDGMPLGIQWTQFRVAIAKPTSAKTEWAGQQIYMAHSAITTVDKHYADEKWSRQHPELAGVSSSPFKVFLDDWQWQSQSEEMFPATLKVQSDSFGYSLSLTTQSPYQKQGEQGFSSKSANGEVASYYYSQPFIHVEGEVTIDGLIKQVTGVGWIDREWSSQFLLDSQQGWDWFALKLNEETRLVVFQLRDMTNSAPNYYYANLMFADGSARRMSSHQIELTPIAFTEIDGRDHPTHWTLNIPSEDIALTIDALNPMAKMPLTVPYWEGPVKIEGSHQGVGYMELTGY